MAKKAKKTEVTETPEVKAPEAEAPAEVTETPEEVQATPEDTVAEYFGSDDTDDLDLDTPTEKPAKPVEASPEPPAETPSDAEPATTTTPAPEELPAQAAKPAESEEPKVPPVVEKEVKAETQPEPQPPAEAPAESITAEALTKQFGEKRAEIETLLADKHYNVPEDMVGALETEPEKVIPRLMARVYMDAVTNSVGHIMGHLPQMLENINQARSVSDKAEEAFFTEWPQLKEHRDTVLKFGQAYRQLYPGAPQDEFIKNVGAQVIVAMRLPHTPEAPTATPAAPAQKPFVPANTGSPPVTQPTAPANPFEVLAAEEETLDLD